ncbi:DNA-binding response regulator, OmpR family, contains REC and winged-helix (wHTH) domain [Sporobacter termitidis DSM 10068]|uniref:Stage 0 sporulation protein A homolog n=1 Tax=Sporobacter termitidis DSM 10068 TaxID=1123282 RepID=A0A1M5WG90_9FIRM|nr:response regulator transcription factor [Sporobacter termitidis]SHH86502.1 DNA-binding response regulator, OmpR family, contains REC and winged-helix (wHTH) domain [Sporobacter termitidis DSM 10068]
MSYKILIIDDDVYIGDMLEEVLKKEGYAVLRAYSGTEALLLFSQARPDLVLLDLMLPGLPGEEVLKKLRGVPVIVLSAKAGADDKVQLLLGGAADYITKPFDTHELLARITVQLRRGTAAGNGARLLCGGLSLDTGTHQVLAGEVPVRLTKTEFAILKLLLQNPKQVITKSKILDLISADTPDCVESSLKVHVSNLRSKLRAAAGKDYIETVWGIGFKMREP